MILEKSKLEQIIPKENIKYDEPMSKHTSFKVGGPAEYFIIAKTVEEARNILKFANENSIPLYILGNGSNLLVLDKGVKGIILKIQIEKLEIEERRNEVIVSVGAGNKMMALAQILKQKEITGFEEFSGVPGTVGGANFMNAGAHGKEMKDIIIETKCLNKETRKIEVLKKEEQQLVYRSSIFKQGKYIILETKISLKKGKETEIEEKMNEYLTQRKSKQPIEYPSAGSTFKRGKEHITAELIDKCGLKGYSIGGAKVSEKHAGFVINTGNATAKEILELINYIKKKVKEKYNVEIQEEIEIIGEK